MCYSIMQMILHHPDKHQLPLVIRCLFLHFQGEIAGRSDQLRVSCVSNNEGQKKEVLMC